MKECATEIVLFLPPIPSESKSKSDVASSSSSFGDLPNLHLHLDDRIVIIATTIIIIASQTIKLS